MTTTPSNEWSSARLRAVKGAIEGTVFEVTRECIAGRADGSAIRVDDSRVSRVHARFTPVSDGVELADMGSANGTRVNGRRIEGPVRLRLGDLVTLGGTVLRVDGLTVAPPVEPEPVLAPTPAPPAPAPPAPPVAGAPPAGAGRGRRGTVVAAVVVVLAVLAGVAAMAASGGSDDAGDALVAAERVPTTAAPTTTGSGAATTSTPAPATSTTVAAVRLPFAAGDCIGDQSRTASAATAVDCTTPEASRRITDIRAGRDLVCPTGALRTSVERTVDGVTSAYAYCSVALPDRDNDLDVGSCAALQNQLDGKVSVRERPCSDPAANYRVDSSTAPEQTCPPRAPKRLSKSTNEATRTGAGSWCLVLLDGRTP